MLEIKNLSYSIVDNNTTKDILKNVNLKLDENKIYVITGPNGSGKSTLVKLIMGILTPTQGQIIFNGEDITSLSINERAKKGISYAFQQPVTFKGLKIKDLLDEASQKKNNLSALCEYLSIVGLCAKDYINRPIDDKLSGGELKRIEIAMSLAREGLLNIFDEPEAGIDLWSFDNLTSIFSSMKEATNVIVSHQKKILEIADEIIMLKGGQVLSTGNYQQILPLIQNNKCGKIKE